VMESILQGHSSSPEMTKLNLEEVYVNYTSQLVSAYDEFCFCVARTSSNTPRIRNVALEYPK
jgi:hypothetical protein